MFINSPNNFASIWNELIFEWQESEPSDILIEIINDRTDESIGVKKFYSSSSAKINIAPMLFKSMMPTASKNSTTGAVNPSTGFPRVVLQVGDTQSPTLYFTYAKEQAEEDMILRTMPANRILYADECDQITMIGAEGELIVFTLRGIEHGQEEYSTIRSYYTSIDGGVRVFHLLASEWVNTYKTISVDCISGTTTLGTITYSLESQAASGYRVAWLSQRGSIEHYTFPIVASSSQLSSGKHSKTLRSAYGTAEEIEAISEIISSPLVWRVEAGEYTQIEVDTTEQSIQNEGVLAIVNIKILEND